MQAVYHADIWPKNAPFLYANGRTRVTPSSPLSRCPNTPSGIQRSNTSCYRGFLYAMMNYESWLRSRFDL